MITEGERMAGEIKNPYETLGVSKNATAAEIKSAYLSMNCRILDLGGCL
jgi:DnaJ-class molecular chaperone